MDGDGVDERLVFANTAGSTPNIDVYLWDGASWIIDPNFPHFPRISLHWHIKALDLDSDGVDDAVYADGQTNQVGKLYLYDVGTGAWTEDASFNATHVAPNHVRTTDALYIDRDGDGFGETLILMHVSSFASATWSSITQAYIYDQTTGIWTYDTQFAAVVAANHLQDYDTRNASIGWIDRDGDGLEETLLLPNYEVYAWDGSSWYADPVINPTNYNLRPLVTPANQETGVTGVPTFFDYDQDGTKDTLAINRLMWHWDGVQWSEDTRYMSSSRAIEHTSLQYDINQDGIVDGIFSA